MQRRGVLAIECASVEAFFIDPPVLLSGNYADYSIDPGTYYARETRVQQTGSNKRKRSKKKKLAYIPNAKELLAQQRHQEARGVLVEAHEAFMSSDSAQAVLKNIVEQNADYRLYKQKQMEHIDFVQLSKTFQAPMYETTLLTPDQKESRDCGALFDNFIEASPSMEEVATCAGCEFLLPKCSRFLMSDFSQIHQLFQVSPASGYNLIIIDPPWENKSVHRKSLYPTLPNKYLLSLKLQQLVHKEGALIGLWITNREKLHQFVEKELFPAWGVAPTCVWYWLKIKETGELMSDLDVNHHKPYECLLIARVPKKEDNVVPNTRVFISIPGEHSRKPPLGLVLEEFVPGPRPVKAVELFAREMNANWTCWGNEPLRFQNRNYFIRRL